MKYIFLIISIGIIFFNFTMGIGSESDLTTWLILIWGVCALIDIRERVKK